MDNETDRLYQWVFDSVREVWAEVQKHAKEWAADEDEDCPPTVAPDTFLIRECGGADIRECLVAEPVLRDWIFDGADFAEQIPTRGVNIDAAPPGIPLHLIPPIRTEAEIRDIWTTKTFFRQGLVCFHISTDRKHIVFNFLVGGKYGRGVVYDVETNDMKDGWIS